MGIEELEKLVSQGLQLGLQGPELRAWVDVERAKLKGKREADRAAQKAAHERRMAELTAQLDELQRQCDVLKARQEALSISNGSLHSRRNAEESTEGAFAQLNVEPERACPKLVLQEEPVSLAGCLIREPCIVMSQEDTVRPQGASESTEAEDLDVSETDSSLRFLALECEGSSKRECLDRQCIRAQMVTGLPAKFSKVRQRRRRRNEREMSSTKLMSKRPSDSTLKSNQMCLRSKLGFCDYSKRMPIPFKASLVKLREISSAEPASKRLARQASIKSGQAKDSGQSICRYHFSTRKPHRKEQTPTAHIHFYKLEGNNRKLERPRHHQYRCRQNFYGQPCWKYRRKLNYETTWRKTVAQILAWNI